MPDEFLNEHEAANLLGRCAYTLRDWRQKNVGPVYSKVVGRVVYRKSDIDAFIESCRIDPKELKEKEVTAD
jgi:hypothetical protein